MKNDVSFGRLFSHSEFHARRSDASFFEFPSARCAGTVTRAETRVSGKSGLDVAVSRLRSERRRRLRRRCASERDLCSRGGEKERERARAPLFLAH